ncbi:DUF3995 domain-containing protein [Streptomyces sp. RY43-2]|uniref:DUF3995 domain-containing protein n=1 Tax=Streptomyces macrolidinus TaxID=2952607 RepID=A0ABT0ZJX4_9ACTN|nr:DUF3995 domain-containing protein [Streptomyces macrolidinus]MCN9243851.1 DUF3995 domain-containing protein [Streptomyces macrolidinus]
MTKLAGGTAAVGLGAVGALHGIWIFSPWPLADRAEFARTVVGVAEEELPTSELTAAVAAALGAASYVIAAQADLVPQVRPRRLVRQGVWGVAGVLLLRGAAGLVSSGLTSRPTDFTRWDLSLYSPLCLTLGGLTAYVATSTRTPRRPERRHAVSGLKGRENRGG